MRNFSNFDFHIGEEISEGTAYWYSCGGGAVARRFCVAKREESRQFGLDNSFLYVSHTWCSAQRLTPPDVYSRRTHIHMSKSTLLSREYNFAAALIKTADRQSGAEERTTASYDDTTYYYQRKMPSVNGVKR